MNAFLHIFAYLNLGTGVITGIVTIQQLIAAPVPVTAAELVAVAEPIIGAIQQIFPKVKVPMDLVTTIADSTALAINKHFHKA